MDASIAFTVAGVGRLAEDAASSRAVETLLPGFNRRRGGRGFLGPRGCFL